MDLKKMISEANTEKDYENFFKAVAEDVEELKKKAQNKQAIPKADKMVRKTENK